MNEVALKPAPELMLAATGSADRSIAVSGSQTRPPALENETGISPRGESSHELGALHGLRFIAAFCVLLPHACTWLANFKDNHVLNFCGEFLTTYGMPLFFVLSGFVIHYNYSRLFSTMRPRWAIVEFLGARFARIYPLFICFFLVGIAVDGMLQWADHHKLNLFVVVTHALTLTQSWVYIVIYGDRLALDNGFGLSWSLSTEFFFYLSYLVLALHIARLRSVLGLLFTAALMSTVVYLALSYGASHHSKIEAFAREHLNDHFSDWNSSAYRWFFYYSPYVRVFEFMLGCLTAQIYACRTAHPISSAEARLGRYLLGASISVLFAFSLINLFAPFGPSVDAYIKLFKLNYGPAIPIAALIFCVARYKSSAVAMILSAPIMILLGELSFSIYVIHTWTLRIFERPTMTFSWMLGFEAIYRIVLAVALTITLSYATYHLIEVPARARLRKAVSNALLRNFGTREANSLPVGHVHSNLCAAILCGSFIAMIAAVLVYQFLVVPYFTPYTN